MYKKRLQVEVLLSTFVKVLHWMYDLFFFCFFPIPLPFCYFYNVFLYDF